MEHVKDNIYAEQVMPGCNVGIIPTGRGTLIVDTPVVSRQAERINDELLSAGFKPVRFIAITHHHGDHILGTSLFGRDVLIIGNRITYENMHKYSPSWAEDWAKTWTWENPDDVEEMIAAQILLPEIIFKDELTLHLDGIEIWLFPLPGHLAESTGAFVPDSGVLITGDALFCDHHPYIGEGNFQVWFESLKKMKDLGADSIIPGHGPVCDNEAIDKQQRYMERMMEIRSKWNPADGEAAIPPGAVDELLSFYSLHGRSEAMMRGRIIESIRIAGDPKF